MPTGQFYAVGVDMRRPVLRVRRPCRTTGASAVRARRAAPRITNSDWYRIGGGDGFYALIDPTDYNTVYTESQNGSMSRLDLRTGERVNIRPRARPRPPQAGQPAATAPQTSNIVPEPPVGERTD